MIERKLLIADFCIAVRGENFCRFIGRSGAFRDFLTEAEAEFSVVEDLEGVSVAEDFAGGHVAGFEEGALGGELESLYEIEFEGVACRFCRRGADLYFTMHDGATGDRLVLKWRHGETVVHATPMICRDLVTRFGLWMAVNSLLITRKCAAIHSSVNVCEGSALMCLGESGTGKSTHTRLLREVFPEIFLLNDDSPFVRAMDDGTVSVYGSPWSGKTPCYKQLAYPLKAVIRLSQAPYNKIHRLSPLAAIGALQPSLPPAFNYDDRTQDAVYALLSDVVSAVRFYHLECLPDHAAARLSHDEIFGENNG